MCTVDSELDSQSLFWGMRTANKEPPGPTTTHYVSNIAFLSLLIFLISVKAGRESAKDEADPRKEIRAVLLTSCFWC